MNAQALTEDDRRRLTAKRRHEMRKNTREEVDAIFRLAGFTVSTAWELANGYWPDHPDYDDARDPWWLMLTEIGPVQIGWRKNVMHIQWDACAVRAIVTPDQVTKADTYVHAWRPEKAVEYLKTLREAARKTSEPSRSGEEENDMRASGEKPCRLNGAAAPSMVAGTCPDNQNSEAVRLDARAGVHADAGSAGPRGSHGGVEPEAACDSSGAPLRKVAEAALSVYRAWDRELHYVNKMFALGRELRDAGYELRPDRASEVKRG